MKILFFDIDTLRQDHLGCYGYSRNTSPVIDSIAKEGVLFENYYCPNAPCLPSRASMITGQYGIHNGIVGHGGTAADLNLLKTDRHFRDRTSENSLFKQFRKGGLHTVSFSTFAERHSAWWFNSGLNESYNVGFGGGEIAGPTTDLVLDWLERNKDMDNWMLHIHYWDPHTPYRTPKDYERQFKGSCPETWITEEIFEEHLQHIGPHGANEINMWNDDTCAEWPNHPGKLVTKEDADEFMSLYDDGIRYTDDNIGKIIQYLKDNNLYDDELAIIITSDHGEDMGELGIYAEHGVADEPVCHIPLVIKWPHAKKGHVAKGFYDNVDLVPSVNELLRVSSDKGHLYDGVSFAKELLEGKDCSRPNLVLTQCAHVCQRSARFDDFIYIRTLHGGGHLFPDEMLFNVQNDPHELHDLAGEHPELCAKGAKIILDWTEDMMKSARSPIDPMWTVMSEGGPEHCKDALIKYMKRLEGTSREYGIPLIKEKYGLK